MKAPFFPGWWQVVTAFIVQAVSVGSIFTAYSVIALQLQEAFEPSRMVLMLGVTVTALAIGILSPPLGSALDRYSVRTLMLGGAGFLAIGFFLLSFTTSMIQVLVVYMVFMSIGSLLLGPLATSALLARWFSRRRGLAMGIAACGAAIGGLLIPPFLQYLIEGFEWRTALQIFSGVIIFFTGFVIAVLVIDRPSDRNLWPDGDDEPSDVAEKQDDTLPISTASVLRSTNFWLIAITIGLIFSGPLALLSNLIPFVVDKNIDASRGALLLSVLSGANFAGKLLCAAIADRIDVRLVLASMLVVLGFGFFGYLHSDDYTMLVVSSVVIGISQGAAMPLWGVLVARIYGPDNIGRVMGLMNFVFTPFMLIAPPLFGLIFDLTGSYDNALIGYLIVLAFLLLLLPRFRTDAATPVPPPVSH